MIHQDRIGVLMLLLFVGCGLYAATLDHRLAMARIEAGCVEVEP